ncbi:MAG: hypothetical protein JKY65_33450 [Planctomycetes bacterium]|nr:hypothetical protein [Planctomycetota bacterium]
MPSIAAPPPGLAGDEDVELGGVTMEMTPPSSLLQPPPEGARAAPEDGGAALVEHEVEVDSGGVTVEMQSAPSLLVEPGAETASPAGDALSGESEEELQSPAPELEASSEEATSPPEPSEPAEEWTAPAELQSPVLSAPGAVALAPPVEQPASLNGFLIAGTCLVSATGALGAAVVASQPDQLLYGALILGLGVPVGWVLFSLGIVARVWPPQA